MKKLGTVLILGIFFIILALSLISLVSAYTCPAGSHTLEGGTQADGPEWCIPDAGAGVCSGPQRCTCDGVNYFSCACNSNPCTLCSPGTLAYQESRCAGPSGNPSTGNTGPLEPNTMNPQTPGDYVDLLANGFNNLLRTVAGKPAVVGGKEQSTLPTPLERGAAGSALAAMALFAGLMVKSILGRLLIRRRMPRAQPIIIRKRKLPSPLPRRTTIRHVR